MNPLVSSFVFPSPHSLRFFFFGIGIGNNSHFINPFKKREEESSKNMEDNTDFKDYFEETPSIVVPEHVKEDFSSVQKMWPAEERLYKVFPREEEKYAGCRSKGRKMLR